LSAFGICRRSLAALSALLVLASSAGAAEPYEGAWARTPKDCGAADGPTSLTVIDLKVSVDGKPMPMFEQYENHCFLEKRTTVGNSTKVSAACYEFWDDFRKRMNGRKTTIELSLTSKDVLEIDGKAYRRCPGKAMKKRG
jgi:hypothetical protein